jgi:hypothetical protein
MKYVTILLLLSLVTSVGCNKEEETTESTPTFVAPEAPGGDISGLQSLSPVFGLTADNTIASKVTLNYSIPSTYNSLDYKIFIYRINGDGVGFSFPDPSDELSGSFVHLVQQDFAGTQSNVYTDSNALNSGSTYTYFLFITLDDRWSTGVKVTTTATSLSNAIDIPGATEFWPALRQRIGTKPAGAVIFAGTMSPGTPAIGRPKGVSAWDETGNLMYYADTDNNRVIVYTTSALSACSGFDEDSIDYEICYAIYQGYPLTATAVLGQADFLESYECGEAGSTLTNDKCLTKPSGLLIHNNKLYIADSGNDRIVVHNILPQFGCHHIKNEIGEVTEDECAPAQVIGKKTLLDTTDYDIATDGDVALKFPTGMDILGNDLYIADTDNHRIVIVKSVQDSSVHFCTADNFKTSLCSFAGVLGQESLFTNIRFQDEYDASNIIYDFGNDKTNDNGEFLSKHFSYPTQVKFDENAKMLIAANEDFTKVEGFGTISLYGRILVYNSSPLSGGVPTCRDATFSGDECKWDFVFGQISAEKLVQTTGDYSAINYALRTINFDFAAEHMIGVDYENNHVFVWDDRTDQGLGNPYSFKVNDPNGAFESSINANLPDLSNINQVEIVNDKGAAYISDPGNGTIFEVPIFSLQQL